MQRGVLPAAGFTGSWRADMIDKGREDEGERVEKEGHRAGVISHSGLLLLMVSPFNLSFSSESCEEDE